MLCAGELKTVKIVDDLIVILLNNFKEALNNVSEAVRARQKSAKKRSLQVVNEHFELIFNNVLTT